MGYRLRVRKTDSDGKDRTIDVEGGGGTTEATIEDLSPWIQYQVQIQAFNSIGPGPWSPSVAAHTAESGMNTDLIHSSFLLSNRDAGETYYSLGIRRQMDEK